MLQVNPYYFFDFGRVIESVGEWAISTRPVDEKAARSLTGALEFLNPIVEADELTELPLPQSADPARVLRDLIRIPLATMMADAKNKSEIVKAVVRFQHVFDAELDTKNFLLVEEIGIYSASGLLNHAHKHLDPGVVVAVLKLAPKAKDDFAFAGRALALELNTASGFHAMRAVEAVARSYHMTVKQRSTVVENQPLSAVINELRDHMKSNAGNKQVDAALSLNVELLSKLDRIYRCPIMHPEMTLDNQKAKEVFDLSASAISAMVEDIKSRMQARRLANP